MKHIALFLTIFSFSSSIFADNNEQLQREIQKLQEQTQQMQKQLIHLQKKLVVEKQSKPVSSPVKKKTISTASLMNANHTQL